MRLVSAPKPGPLEFLENDQVAALSQRFVPEGLGCTWVQQILVREEVNQRSVAPVQQKRKVASSPNR